MRAVSLVLQHTEHAAHCGIAGRVGKISEHFRRRGFFAAEEYFHDLTFATPELGEVCRHASGLT